MRHQLYREQRLNCDIETAWRFFSSPRNLREITPGYMNFRVLKVCRGEQIFEGMRIAYRVSPLLNIPLKWQTLITQVEGNRSFTDFQEKGPYRYWKHFHEFIPERGGVLMKDTVDYELPFGFLGDVVHQLWVKQRLSGIFDFRSRVLENYFKQVV